MKVLLTGKKGQLGTEFLRFFKEKKDITLYAFSHQELDIGSLKDVLTIFDELQPDVVINCAAYNQVDRAEEDYPEAIRTNAIGPRNLAFASERTGALLVHYSTDYVFDGKKRSPYTEDDRPNPLSEYGKSKYLGELFIREETDRYLIFRVSWVFGPGKQNFIYKLLHWANTQPVLRISEDEVSVPTWTGTIVEVTWKAIERGLKGLYHLTTQGEVSRFEWARFVLDKLGIEKPVEPVSSSVFNLPARRPGYSVLDSSNLFKALSLEAPHWKETVEDFLKAYGHELEKA